MRVPASTDRVRERVARLPPDLISSASVEGSQTRYQTEGFARTEQILSAPTGEANRILYWTEQILSTPTGDDDDSIYLLALFTAVQ